VATWRGFILSVVGWYHGGGEGWVVSNRKSGKQCHNFLPEEHLVLHTVCVCAGGPPEALRNRCLNPVRSTEEIPERCSVNPVQRAFYKTPIGHRLAPPLILAYILVFLMLRLEYPCLRPWTTKPN
jgi:hypothetical protein